MSDSRPAGMWRRGPHPKEHEASYSNITLFRKDGEWWLDESKEAIAEAEKLSAYITTNELALKYMKECSDLKSALATQADRVKDLEEHLQVRGERINDLESRLADMTKQYEVLATLFAKAILSQHFKTPEKKLVDEMTEAVKKDAIAACTDHAVEKVSPVDDACQGCEGKGEWTTVALERVYCRLCNGTGKRRRT